MDCRFPPPAVPASASGSASAAAASTTTAAPHRSIASTVSMFRTPVRPTHAHNNANTNAAPFPPPAIAATPSNTNGNTTGTLESPPTVAPPTPVAPSVGGASASLSSFVHWGSSPLSGPGSSPPTVMQWAGAASTPSRRRPPNALPRAVSPPANGANDAKGNKRPPPPHSPSKPLKKRVRAPNIARAFSADQTPSAPISSAFSPALRSQSSGFASISSLLSEIDNEVAKSDQLVRSNGHDRVVRGRSVESFTLTAPSASKPTLAVFPRAGATATSRPPAGGLHRIPEASPARPAAAVPVASQHSRPLSQTSRSFPAPGGALQSAAHPNSRSSSPMPLVNDLESSIDMAAFFSDDDDFWADAAASLDKIDVHAAPAVELHHQHHHPQPPSRISTELHQPPRLPQPVQPTNHHPPDQHHTLRDPSNRPFPTTQLPIRRYSVIHALMFSNEVHVLVVPDPPPAPPANATIAPILPSTFILRDQWRQVDLNPGDIVHLVRTPSDPSDPSLLSIQPPTLGPNDPWALHEQDQLGPASAAASSANSHPPIIIDGTSNLLIVHPDTLVSGSVVAEAFTCIRRAVLKDRVRSRGISRAQILGTLAHDVVQEMLVSGHAVRAAAADSSTFNVDAAHDAHVIADVYQAAVSRRSVDLAAAGITSDEAKQWVMGVWDRTLRGLVKPAMVQRVPELDVHIESVVDIEENVWAPGVGLKGKLDGTLVASVPRRVAKVIRTSARSDRRVDSGFGDRIRGIVPLEIKTGKARPLAHRAQTMLYSLLLLDAYDPFAVLPVGGVLYNAGAAPPAPHKGIDGGGLPPPAVALPPEGESAAPEVVTLNHAEMRDLVITRNQVAAAMRKPTAPLPKVLGPAGAASTCARCFSVAQCMVIHASVEHGKKDSAGIEGAWETLVGHLTPKHLVFLRHWLHLVDLEHEVEESMPVWVRDREQRQGGGGGGGSGGSFGLQGGCVRGLEFIRSVDAPAMPNDKPKVHSLFRVQVNAEGEFEGLPEDPDLTTGDMVIVSREGGPYGLAQGFVHHVDRFGLTVSLDRPFRVDPRMARASRDMFRVDKYELVGLAASTMRANLIDMFLARESHLRDLVVDLHPPRAISTVAKRQFPATQNDAGGGGSGYLASLNARQRDVIERCTTNEQDYTLVVGMPGTGKSTTLAHMLRRLVHQGAKVLLSSHTHSAVDTVLIKARELDVPFLRLGAPDRVHASIRDATLAGRTPEMIQRAFSDARVVGVTCLGVSHSLLQPPSVTPSVDKDPSAMTATRPPLFDVCIIDEASQTALPIALGPLALARRFILVGDHHQLSPIVRNPLAAQGGLAVSLFERLLEAHPRSACFLDVQYRMNEEITELVNAATYHGRLTCGSEKVASQRLELPRGVPQGTPGWIRHALIGPSVVFLNVTTGKETAVAATKGVHGGLINNVQVEMVKQLAAAMALAGVQGEDIGVITPYRAQLARIRAALDAAAAGDGGLTQAEAASVGRQIGKVECCTIDQYQGRDKTVIVVSLVRCNSQGQTGDLLRDWKRINVAMTRARCKLILIGCAETLRHSLLWATALNAIEGRGWKVTVDPKLP